MLNDIFTNSLLVLVHLVSPPDCQGLGLKILIIKIKIPPPQLLLVLIFLMQITMTKDTRTK